MIKSVRVYTEDAKQVRVTVTENYANAFLAIFNNVKSDPDLYKVENDYENDIYVTCSADSINDVKAWLSKFGEVKSVETVLMLFAHEPDYDLDKYYDIGIAME